MVYRDVNKQQQQGLQVLAQAAVAAVVLFPVLAH
jgi:hypothetical protein